MSESDQDSESEDQTTQTVDTAGDETGSEGSDDDVTFDEGDADSDDASLGQSEIDDLFGIGAGDDGPDTGIYALLNCDSIKHRHLPLLEACFDRLVHALAKAMRHFTSSNVELSLVNTSSVRYGTYIDAVPMPALVSVFKVVEWHEYGLVNIDTALIYAIIDVLLGGRRTATSPIMEARSFTAIEAKLVERMIILILKEMAIAFKPLADVDFKHERLESNPSLAEIASPTNIAILYEIEVNMEDRGGRIEILIPYTTLEPVRDMLEQMFMGEKFGQDPIWKTHLASELLLSDVEVEVTFGSQAMPLQEILSLDVGSTLKLRNKAHDPVTLCCGQTPLLRANVGRVGEQLAIKVDDWISKGHGCD